MTFPDSHRMVFIFRSWLDLLDVVLAFWVSIRKNLKITSNCLHRVIDIASFEKHLESSLDHTPSFCRNLVIFRSKDMYLEESLTRSSTVIEHQNFPWLKLIEIVILWVYYTIPFGFRLFWHFWSLLFNFLSYMFG